MNLEEWRPWYRRIVRLLGLDEKADREATLRLAELVKGKTVPLQEVSSRIAGRNVMVFGAGPSLERDVESLLSAGFPLKRLTFIAADGAASLLLKEGLTPHLIVSDLDGRVEDFLKAEGRGSLLVVHGHGDNMDALERWVPRFGRVLATTQVEPVEGLVYNFGGFTDGDRAVFLAEAFKARRIILAGMDLGVKVGRFSKPGLTGTVEAPPRKRIKLQIAKELISLAARRIQILNFTSQGENIPGVEKVSRERLKQVLEAQP